MATLLAVVRANWSGKALTTTMQFTGEGEGGGGGGRRQGWSKTCLIASALKEQEPSVLFSLCVVE